MSEDTRFYAAVVVVEATGYDEARERASDGRVVGVPWPVNTEHGELEDAIRLIDQHPEADF